MKIEVIVWEVDFVRLPEKQPKANRFKFEILLGSLQALQEETHVRKLVIATLSLMMGPFYRTVTFLNLTLI